MAPELLLRRELAQLLHDWGLAIWAPSGQLPERGVKVQRPMPTTRSEFTFLTSQPTTSDGRAGALYRVQFLTVRTGEVESWAAALHARLDQAEYTPNTHGISWAWESSRLYFDTDTQGRESVACNYSFRGRRP